MCVCTHMVPTYAEVVASNASPMQAQHQHLASRHDSPRNVVSYFHGSFFSTLCDDEELSVVTSRHGMGGSNSSSSSFNALLDGSDNEDHPPSLEYVPKGCALYNTSNGERKFVAFVEHNLAVNVIATINDSYDKDRRDWSHRLLRWALSPLCGVAAAEMQFSVSKNTPSVLDVITSTQTQSYCIDCDTVE